MGMMLIVAAAAMVVPPLPLDETAEEEPAGELAELEQAQAGDPAS